MSVHSKFERHRSAHIPWLRAAVLGANDGILSTSSLIVGVAAAHSSPSAIVLSGMAGLIAGAMSMGAGEYVSVSSQRDTENADLARERAELATQLDAEYEELTAIYQTRGLSRHLAEQVSKELMEHDALGAHARDELGIFTTARARPIQAALTSAIAFSLGALFPVSMAFFVPSTSLIASVIGSSLFLLAVLGAIAGAIGGAHPGRGAVRVVFWGVLAQALTTLIGHFMGSSAPL